MALFDIGGKFKPLHVAGQKESRFIEPHDCQDIADYRVKYSNAEKLVSDIGDIDNKKRVFAILDGKFIFGDFIEALVVRNNWLVEDLTISTLSMSQDNIDSLKNLLVGGYVMQMNIIISHYYFANERGGLMPYLYENLDIDNKLQIAVASVHTKIAMIKTACGKTITIHGSANLRTSSNIEQIVIEGGEDIYNFCYGIHASIVDAHKTINKPVRRNALWQAVLTAQEEVPASLNIEQPELQRSEETRSDKQQRKQHKAGA